MTRGSPTASHTQIPTETLVCNGTENGFHDSSVSLNHRNEDNPPLYPVVSGGCHPPKPNKEEFFSLTDEHSVCQINKTSNGILTKSWKSVGVLCEVKNSRTVSKRKNLHSRFPGEFRSCERQVESIVNGGPVRNGDSSGKNLTELALEQFTNEDVTTNGVEESLEDRLSDVEQNGSCCSVETISKPHSCVRIDARWDEERESNAFTSTEEDIISGGINPNTKVSSCQETADGCSTPDSSLSRSPKVNTITSEEELVGKSDQGASVKINQETTQPTESQKISDVTEDNQTNLIVNYLPQNMSQEEIRNLFATIGEVDSCKLIKDKNTSQNLGYGFVNYIHSKDAERAIATLNGLQLQNKTIKVSLARPSSESIKGANLYISGLPSSMTQQKLEELFNSCGRIITSRILYDSNTGASRGVGFIRFDQRVEAERAIKQLNGIVPENGTEPITVKLANSPAAAAAAAAAAASTSSAGNTNGIRFHLNGLPSSEFGLVDEAVFSNKPNQAALTTTMMLLQQAASQAADPFNPIHRISRLSQQSAGSLLPSPYQYPHPRMARQNYLTRQLNPVTRRLFAAAAAALQQQQQQQQQQQSGHQPHLLTQSTASGLQRNPVRMTHPLCSVAPSASPVVPNLFSTQANLFPALATHSQPPFLYPRYRHPSQGRAPGMLGSPTNTPMNGILQPPPIQSTGSHHFAAYAVPAADGSVGLDPFNPCSLNALAATTTFVNCATLGQPCAELAPGTPIPIGFNSAALPGAYGAPPVLPPLSIGPGLPNFRSTPIYSQSTPVGSNSYLNSGLMPWCLFVCNLPPDCEEATLWRLFGPFGAVRSVKVVRDAATNRCRGFGFVNMTNYAEAALAIHYLNGYAMGDRHLQVMYKLPTCPVPPHP